MRTFTTLCSAILLGIGSATPTYAQVGDADEAVRPALREITAAVVACDINAYRSHWDKDASIFIVRGDSLMAIATYLDTWRQVCAGGGHIAFESQGEQISTYDNVALVTGIADWTFTAPDGTSNSGRQRSTTVLRKTPDGWKIVHAHGSELRDP